MKTRPLYHLLDPFWSRFPWPDTIAARADDMAGVTRLRFARRYLGREMMAVYAYVVGDTLVDTAFPAARRELLDLASRHGVKRVFVTHHHEDHSGNAAALVAAGLEVKTTPLTARLLAHDLPLPFYQHLAWGRPRPVELEKILGETIELGGHEARVVTAPGHAVDQVVLHVPEEGWLFSADVFIHPRVKVFRRDEDFVTSVKTLERVLELDFDALFCGHRPLATGGREALRTKLEWLRHLEGETRRLSAEGLGTAAIARRLGLGGGAFPAITFGDASGENVVRSILHGPRPRPEVAAVPLPDPPGDGFKPE